MEIRIAKQYGFCFGVRRAIDLADEFQGSLTTYGPLVHNPQEINRLKQKGVRSTMDIDMITTPTMLVRAHGIAPTVMNALKAKGTVIDGTCPLVKKVHGIAQMLHNRGYTILIFGQANHPETLGIQGYIDNKGIVIHNKAEAELFTGNYDSIALISQTTEIVGEFDDVQSTITKKFPHLRVIDTICDPTKQNQEAAIELAKACDLVIVVGGKESSNTRKLRDNCAKITRSIHIENIDELDKIDLRGVSNLGLTAGASTPDWLFQQVVNRAKELASSPLTL